MKKILWGLAALFCIAVPIQKSSAQAIWPAAAGDSMRVEFNCLDSLGKAIACDSVWFTCHRYPTSGNRVLVDSGRATAFGTGTAIGTGKVMLLPGRDTTYLLSIPGNSTVGYYQFNIKAYGGTMGAAAVKLTTPYTRWFVVGPAVTSTYLAAADPQASTIAAADFAAGAIDATAIATGAVDADAIAANAIGASEIATDAIGAVETAADADMLALSANGRKFNATFDGATNDNIDANVVLMQSNTITAAAITDGAIGAAEIAADAIGASEIATAAITQTEVEPDYAEQSEVVNIDGWNPITDNDSLVIDGTALSGFGLTVGTNNDKTGYSLSAADKDLLADVVMVRKRGTVGAGSTTGKIISTNFVGLNDDDIANNIIVFLPGATTNRYRTAYVTRFFNTGDSAVIRPLLSTTPAAGDSFAVIGIMGKTVSSDSTQALNATATVDSSLLWRIHQAAWGRGAGQAGFDNVYANGDSLTTAQRVVTGGSGSVTVNFHAGTGNRTVTITTVDSAGGFPAVAGALVTLIDSTSKNVAGHLPSNVSGITTFTVNDGGYYIKTSKPGFRPIYGSSPSPQDSIYLRVSGNTSRTDTIEGVAQILPVVAGKCNLYGYVQDVLGDSLIDGLEIQVEFANPPNKVECCTTDTTATVLIPKFAATTKANVNGRWEFNLYPSSSLIPTLQYKVSFKLNGNVVLTKILTVSGVSQRFNP